MDPKQILILMFIMKKKMHQKKFLKRRQESIIQLLTVRYFRRTFMQRARQVFLQMLSFQTGIRRYWMMHYTQLWFETMWDTREDDVTKELWKKEFRMSVKTFQYLLDLIGVNLQRLDTRFRKAIKVEKRLAIVIWRLSTGNS